MTGEVLVRCEDVGRTYGRGRQAVVALHRATCDVAAGARVAIVGPSGSGKSTLLHLMGGLERPTVGRIGWPGLPDGPADPAEVGLVFQAPTLIGSLSAVENVALPLLLGAGPTTYTDARRAALDALALVDLAGSGDALPQELSGGQAQRVVIARVLACRPQLILADEPTSQLDRATAAHVTDVLLETAGRTGAALVVATHDQAVAERMELTWPIVDGRLHPIGDLADESRRAS